MFVYRKYKQIQHIIYTRFIVNILINIIVLGLIRVHVGAEVFFFIWLFMHVGVCVLEYS